MSPLTQSSSPATSDVILLTLRILPHGKKVEIIWEANEVGRYSSKFRTPYDSDTLHLVVKALDAVQYPSHPIDGPQFGQVERDRLSKLGLWKNDRVVADIDKRIGQVLFDRLLADAEAKMALSSARNAAISSGKTLAYLLRFPPEAVELAALPWELLWDRSNPLILSQGNLASFVRYLDLDQALPPPSAPGTSLRILAVAPNSLISPEIHIAERKARIAAWDKLEQAGGVALEELNPATIMGLVERIQNGPFVDILHFYGHGHYTNGQGELLFDTPEGGQTWVSANRLAALLSKTRLVMLHACQSAMIGEGGLLTGVAPALTAAGVPMVVAMQLTIRIKAATRFCGIVYHGLARGESVQQAVSRARQALFVEAGDGVSWYVPTLTIRARDTGPLHLIQK